jgi:hypothetical protein
MVTDEQMIQALKTVRQYCKEKKHCHECKRSKECVGCLNSSDMPEDWKLPGDDEIIAGIGELNENDE